MMSFLFKSESEIVRLLQGQHGPYILIESLIKMIRKDQIKILKGIENPQYKQTLISISNYIENLIERLERLESTKKNYENKKNMAD